MIIFGKQCFEYVFLHSPKQIQEVYLSKEIPRALFQQICKHNIKILRIDNQKAQALAHGKNHQGILARITDIELMSLKEIIECNSLLILCGLTDVGNIGSIIRTAYAMGVEGVILCDRESLRQNTLEGIFRVSSGALLNLPFCFEPSSLEVANQLKNRNFFLLGAGMQNDVAHCTERKNDTLELKTTKSYKKWALFIGKEDSGLKQKLLKRFDKIIHIEMANQFNSLNVSIATGILLDRIRCQRL
ncbi:23S rRNA (guanosine(2251)-2'-O)-methyltransferase RlmB [Helicobacter aurati]|uniref:23S rRNA (Guanosine(2251)-2'-O)-methyltransferase RlmB n=1 Tax=Helicobacter aurati TaxID=137778 RepID=A0A3D8J360_9HELI|nr:23S rRNA (guanosine(2251)-2'-O)-methyltransferase RlmB [Helicobacter aurati]RDU71585.1 23S rRNA (guanosine(2251)-2'-O)-methyltransferase RlmB [Helicobacter aurati]